MAARGGDDAASSVTAMAAVASEGEWAHGRRRRSPRPSYWVGVMVLFAFDAAVWLGLWVISGQLGVHIVFNMLVPTFIVPWRRRKDLHVAHSILTAFTAGVVLPVSVIQNSPETWFSFGFATVAVIVGMVMCARLQLREFGRPHVWLVKPSGQEILLDARPYRCRRCDQRHLAVFALGGPMSIELDMSLRLPPELGTDVTVTFRFVYRNGTAWLLEAPEDLDRSRDYPGCETVS